MHDEEFENDTKVQLDGIPDSTGMKNPINSPAEVEILTRLAYSISEVLWTADLELNISYISPSIEKLTGDKPSVYSAKSLNERYPESSIRMIRETLQHELIREQDPTCNRNRFRNIELEHYKTDGSIIWIASNVTFVRNEQGLAVGLQGVAWDITSRREADELLKLTKRTYWDIINTLSEAIYIQNEQGTFIEVNEGAARMYHCTRKDLIGKSPLDVAAPGLNDMDEIWRKSLQVMNTGEPARFEFWAVRDGTEIFPKEVIVNKGKYFGKHVMIATARDISERKLAEDKIQASEELYRKLLMTVPDLIVRADINGTIIFVNDYAQQEFPSVDKDMILGRNIMSFIHPDDLERAMINTQLMFEKPLGPIEYKLIFSTQLEADCEINGGVLYDSHNQPAGMVYVIRNISERRQSEEKLRVSNEILKLVLENIPQYVFWKDRNSVFMGCNNNFAGASGFHSAKEIIGKTDYDMAWKKEEADFFVSCDKRVMESGKPEYHIIEPQTRADGELTWLDTNKVPLFDKQGLVIGILGTYEDITRRKQAEEELRKEARLRELLIEMSSTYINLPIDAVENEIIKSLAKLGDFVSADRCYVFNYNAENELCSSTHEWTREGISSQISELQNIPLANEWVVAFAKGEPLYIPTLADLPQGPAKETLASQDIKSLIAFPMMHKKVCIGFIGFDSVLNHHSYTEIEKQLLQVYAQVLVNITLRKQSEEELIKAKEKAEESDRLKSNFLANMSHEIRTPMNGILGFAALLKEANLTGEEQQEYIALMERSGARMLNIINDIVDISKIESGLMQVNLKEVNINEQIEYIYSFFKHEVLSKNMLLSFANTLPTREATILTDKEKLYAILSNLVKNSIKYSVAGSIKIGYEKKDKAIEFYVRDTGIGIPKHKQHSIFERFVQADMSDTRAYDGAGLGLSIAKAYVEMLGGAIWVNSEEDKGSVFYFTIPYHLPSHTGCAESPIGESLNAEFRTKPLQILIAEDDDVSYTLILKILSNVSKEILRARSGLEAVELCLYNMELDLVLMDIKMPDMNGFEATRQIRQFNPKVVVIAQTAFGLSGDCELALQAGCTDYITKPVSKDELLFLINKYFSITEKG